MNDLEMIPSNPEQKLKGRQWPLIVLHQLFVTWIIIILDKKIYAGDFFNEQGAADSQEFDDYYYWFIITVYNFIIWSIYTYRTRSNCLNTV